MDTTHQNNSAPADELTLTIRDHLYALVRRSGRRSPFAPQTTSIVHDAWLRLTSAGIRREEFAAVAAATVRSIIVDAARRNGRHKRGGGWTRVSLEQAEQVAGSRDENSIDLEDLDRALTELAAIHPRRAKVVELRFFGGLSVVQVASALCIGERTVDLDWCLARAWLRRALEANGNA